MLSHIYIYVKLTLLKNWIILEMVYVCVIILRYKMLLVCVDEKLGAGNDKITD